MYAGRAEANFRWGGTSKYEKLNFFRYFHFTAVWLQSGRAEANFRWGGTSKYEK